MPRTNRVAAVNGALRAAGYAEKLTAGRGYYYWREGDGIFWPSVYVYRADQMTVEQWLAEAAQNKARRPMTVDPSGPNYSLPDQGDAR